MKYILFIVVVWTHFLSCRNPASDSNSDVDTVLFKRTLKYSNVASGTDSLRQYVYLIYSDPISVVENNHTVLKQIYAPVSFVRNKGKYYLIGSAHVLTGLSHLNEDTLVNYPSVFYVDLLNASTGSYEHFLVDISKIKDTIPKNFFYLNPDVFVIPIEIPTYYQIKSVETFLSDEELSFDNVDSAFMFGYPNNELNRQKVMFKGVFDTKEIVLINFTENKHEMDIGLDISSGVIGLGNSGSILFCSLKSGKIIIAGMCIGGRTDRKAAAFVPFVYINQLLKKTYQR